MKLAVASTKGQVAQHFGHCEGFAIVDLDDDILIARNWVQNPGHKPGYLPVFLKELGIQTIIAGGIGESAVQLFENNQIAVLSGITGNVEDTVNLFAIGKLTSQDTVCKEHSLHDC